jgi:hypothetical protein
MATEFDMKNTPLLKFPAQPVPGTEAIPRKESGKLIVFHRPKRKQAKRASLRSSMRCGR